MWVYVWAQKQKHVIKPAIQQQWSIHNNITEVYLLLVLYNTTAITESTSLVIIYYFMKDCHNISFMDPSEYYFLD